MTWPSATYLLGDLGVGGVNGWPVQLSGSTANVYWTGNPYTGYAGNCLTNVPQVLSQTGNGVSATQAAWATLTPAAVGTGSFPAPVGFNGAPPSIPMLGAYTFTSTYDSAAKTALQNLWNAIRTLGLVT